MPAQTSLFAVPRAGEHPVVLAALEAGAVLSVSVSGGKDSQAMLSHLVARRRAEAWPGFDVHASYDADQAGTFLGLAKRSIYDIPEAELPRSRVGGARTAVRFVGLDLLCYRHKLPMVDWASVRDEAEEHMLRRPRGRGPDVRALPSVNGKRRVL